MKNNTSNLYNEGTNEYPVNETLLFDQDMFYLLMDAANMGVLIHEEGKILGANGFMLNFTGYDIREVVGKSILEFVSPESRNIVIEKIQTGYEKPFEAVGIHKNGTRLPVEISSRNYPHENKNIRIAVIKDISRRIKAEEAFLEEEM